MIARRSKALVEASAGALTVGLLRAIKFVDRKRMANFAGALLRKLGPLFKEHRIGRDNLRAAFPEKSDAEIEEILAGVWDNLGRVAVEFAHLDEFHVERDGSQASGGIVVEPETLERYRRMMSNGRGTLTFTCHLANWETAALAAKQLGTNSAVLYRRPNIRAVNDVVAKLRTPLMGELVPAGLDAPVRLARLLQSGVHVGILADQHYSKGVEVTFFGRKCLANPLIASLARQTECPIHGLHMVRLPDGHRFRSELTEAIEPPRDAEGRIDVQGTTQAITAVIEGWIREHPEQWLWLHRRWR
jgi:KDO2-lipid IV(A) lauroyltransferase